MDDAYCALCGQRRTRCRGLCGRPPAPLRFCPTCGRRLTVFYTPGSSSLRCRDHGDPTAF